jgi:hypothetical protein
VLQREIGHTEGGCKLGLRADIRIHVLADGEARAECHLQASADATKQFY